MKVSKMQSKLVLVFFLSFTTMITRLLGIFLPFESIEEVYSKGNVKQIHANHPEQGKRQLNTLFKLGSISDQLDGNQKVRCNPCKKECNPIENPFHPNNPALAIANTSHPSHLPHM